MPSACHYETFRVPPRFRVLLERHGLIDCDSLVETETGTALRRLRTRENWRLDLEDDDRGVVRLYLKKHRTRTIGTRLRALLRRPAPSTPARIEADFTERLAALGVPTMTVAAYAERLRSDGTLVAAFLTEELTGFEQLDLYLSRRFTDRDDPLLKELIDAVGDISGRFHGLGFNHRDFYTCHFFVRENTLASDIADDAAEAPQSTPDGSPETARSSARFAVHLIDLQRVQRWPSWLRRRWIVKDLAQLAYSCPPTLIGPVERLRFFKRALGKAKLDAGSKRLARAVLRKESSLRRRHGLYRDWDGAVRLAATVRERGPRSLTVAAQPNQDGRALRIGLVLDRFDRRLGGVEQWTAQLADRLLARGHEVHVVAKSIAERELRPGLTPHRLPRQRSRIELADAAANLLRRLELDVIHDMGFGWYCDILQPHGGSRIAANRQNLLLSPAWLRPIKQVVAPQLPRYREFDALGRKQYGPPPSDRPGRLIVAISNMVRRDLQRHHDVEEASIRLVYNGVDAARFTPELRSTHREAVRRDLGIDGRQVLFLIVAHNLVLKGVPALLRALALLRAAGHEACLAVVGGRRTNAFERMANRLGVAGAVRFVGAVDDPAPFYVAADVYTQPTWYDPCSLVLLEALACGLPVITTRFNGAGELIAPGVHGELLDDPRDAVSLAAAMARWMEAERREAAASAARELMLANTLDRNVEAMLDVYAEVVARRVPRRDAA